MSLNSKGSIIVDEKEDVRHTHFEGDDLFDVFVILEVELVVALHFYDRLLINIKCLLLGVGW